MKAKARKILKAHCQVYLMRHLFDGGQAQDLQDCSSLKRRSWKYITVSLMKMNKYSFLTVEKTTFLYLKTIS
jgi:hypothetical protein